VCLFVGCIVRGLFFIWPKERIRCSVLLTFDFLDTDLCVNLLLNGTKVLICIKTL
jgi:hypothetical protein